MMRYQKSVGVALLSCLLLTQPCYSERFINLGLTNILDGGFIRKYVGWYFQEIVQFYTADKFLDGKGNLVGGLPANRFNSLAFFSQAVYESPFKIAGANWGVQGYIPVYAYAKIAKNEAEITSSGAGLSDCGMGTFLQWDPVFYNGRRLFVHRLSFELGFPTGKNKEPEKTLNPSSGFFFINPYWAATLHLTQDCTFSWRLFYTWNGTNKRTQKKVGDSIHMNFDAAIQPYQNLWVGCVGYFLKQLRDTTVCGVKVPDSRERVLAVGPGILYNAPAQVDLFGFVYFENLVRNRSQGIKCIFRLIKHF